MRTTFAKAALTLLLTTATITATPNPTPTTSQQHLLIACLYLDLQILTTLKQSLPPSQQKPIQQIIRHIKRGQAIPPHLQRTLLQHLPHPPTQHYQDPQQLINYLRQHLHIQPNIQRHHHETITHPLIPHEHPYHTTSHDHHTLTLTPKPHHTTLTQTYRHTNQRRTTPHPDTEYIPLQQLLHIRFPHLSKTYIQPLLEDITAFLRLEQELDELENKALSHDDYDSDLEQTIEDKEKVWRKAYKNILNALQQLNIPKQDLKPLLQDRDELYYNPRTQQLEVAVNHYTHHQLEIYGDTFLINLKPHPKAHKDEQNILHNLYAYEDLRLQDTTHQNTTHCELESYLTTVTNPTTDTTTYYVSYRVYHRKKDTYTYHRYTNPQDVHRIKPTTYHKDSQAHNTTLLNYRKHTVTPTYIPIPWLSSHQTAHLKSGFAGIAATLLLWCYLQDTYPPPIPRRQDPPIQTLPIQNQNQNRNPPYNPYTPYNYTYNYNQDTPVQSAGLKNLGNTCFMNASLQTIIDTNPDLITQTPDHNVNKAGQALIQAREKGHTDGTGATAQQLKDLRAPIYYKLPKETHLEPLVTPNPTRQQDAGELFELFEQTYDPTEYKETDKKQAPYWKKPPLVEKETRTFNALSIPLKQKKNDLGNLLLQQGCFESNKYFPTFRIGFHLPTNQKTTSLQALKKRYEQPEKVGMSLSMLKFLTTILGENKNEAQKYCNKIVVYILREKIRLLAKEYKKLVGKEKLIYPPKSDKKEKKKKAKKVKKKINLSKAKLDKYDQFKPIHDILTKDEAYFNTLKNSGKIKKIIQDLQKNHAVLQEFPDIQKRSNPKVLLSVCNYLQKVGLDILNPNALANHIEINSKDEKDIYLMNTSSEQSIRFRFYIDKKEELGILPTTKAFRMQAIRFAKSNPLQTFAESVHNKNDIEITGIEEIELPVFKLANNGLPSLPDGTKKAQLTGVVMHLGGRQGKGSEGYGHYTAYSYRKQDQKWYYYDDSSKQREAQPTEVYQAAQTQGYIYYYTVVNPTVKRTTDETT